MADRNRAIDLHGLLKDRIAYLSGGRVHGGPILTFPSWQNTDKVLSEDLKQLILYLANVPSEEVLQIGFTVVVDMRGSTWNNIKPILKVLQEHFPAKINGVYIIKSDNFWQKQKTNFNSNKFSFEIHPVSVDGLIKAISSSQLTGEVGGTLVYDHDEWIEVRIAFEQFIWDALDVLDKLHDIEQKIVVDVFASDQDGAKIMSEEHMKLKKTITSAPIEQLDAQGQKLLKRINGSNCDADSGFSGSTGGVPISGNADFQSAAPRIHSLVEKLHTTRQQLITIWQRRRSDLEHCYQLRQFQQDANKMFEWIKQNRTLFIGGCAEIGSTYQQATDLQESHRHFATNSMSVYVNVHRVMLVANRLLEANHYATEEIRAISANLDLEWKIFAAALDERSRLMGLAVKFHQRVERFIGSTVEWRRECETDLSIPTDSINSVSVLEQNIKKHNNLHERITESYHEVCENGKELLDFLQKPSSPSTDDVLTQLIDYSGASQQVLDSIHEVFHHHRELEKRWTERKVTLTQKHQLRVYEHDVQQVLQWISEHGEAFLAKYTGIGRSLNRAMQLRKRHEDFEDVAQNTYTNAEKLLEAAEQLAQSGECDPHEIFQVARNLEEQMRDFAHRVERRRKILDMSVAFNTHLKELWTAHEAARNEMQFDDAADTLDSADRRMKKFRDQRYKIIDSFVACREEAKNLLLELKCANIDDSRKHMTGAVQHLETLQQQLRIVLSSFEDSCSDYELRLDLSLLFRSYEQEAVKITAEMSDWCDDMIHSFNDILLYDNVVLEQHLTQFIRRSDQIQSRAKEISAKAQDILTQFDQSDVDMVCGENVSVCVRVKELSNQVQIKMRETSVKSIEYRNKLEKGLLLRKLESQSELIKTWIASGEDMLRTTTLNLTNRQSAERCKLEFERCAIATEKTRVNVNQIKADASQLRDSDFSDAAKEIEEVVKTKWHALSRHSDDRNRLINRACKFYLTAEEVWQVLDSLQADYKRSYEWNETTHPQTLLEKHLEQKSRFLHACSLVRKLSTDFCKHVDRTVASFPNDQFSIDIKNSPQKEPERFVRLIRDELLQRENQNLQLWQMRSASIENWQKFRHLVDSMYTWIHDTGEKCKQLYSSKSKNDQGQQLTIKELITLEDTAQGRLYSFSTRAAALVSKDSSFASSVSRYEQILQTSYNDFIRQIQQYKKLLATNLAIPTEQISTPASSSEPGSTPAAFKTTQADGANKDEQESKLTRRQNYIMSELLQTERIYVKDLEDCINYYLAEMTNDNPDLPPALHGQQNVIFGNIVDLHKFHSETFLKELIKYEKLPEDLGHCFVTWAPQFNLYVTYCQNKPTSNEVLVEQAGDFFDKIQAKKEVNNSIASYLIKPVQRITKYQLLLKDLASCCQSDKSEIKEGVEVMLSVPRRANDALHISMIHGYDEDVKALGEPIVQDSFQVLDTKQLIRKGRDRHLFLFELALIVCKETKDSTGKSKYIFKFKYPTCDLVFQDTNEAEDSCKFVVGCSGRSEKLIFKAPSVDIKQEWVKKLKEVVQEHQGSISKFYTASKRANSTDSGLEDDRWSMSTDRWSGSGVNVDSLSIHSRLSGNNENLASGEIARVMDDYSGPAGHLTVKRNQSVLVIRSHDDLVYAQTSDRSREGYVPSNLLSAVTGTSEPELTSGTSSGSDLSSGNHRSKSTSHYSATTSTLPTEKRSGFMKRLPFTSKKKITSGSATVHKIPEQRSTSLSQPPSNHKTSGDSSPNPRSNRLLRKAKTNGTILPSPESSVKHLVTDHPEEEDLPESLPPPMQIVGGNLESNGTPRSSACSVASDSSFNDGNTIDKRSPDLTHSLSTDFGNEMEDILKEKFSKTSLSKEKKSDSEVWVAKVAGRSSSSDNLVISDKSDDVFASSLPETILSNGSVPTEDPSSPAQVDDEKPKLNQVEASLETRRHVLMELIETEREYVADLATITNGYMAKVLERGLPQDAGKERVLFGNIAQIYEWHRDVFQKEIEACGEEPERLGGLFVRYERRLHMYVKYCQNKPLSEYLVHRYKTPYFTEIQSELKTKLDIADYLIKPVQRVMKYQLLLKDFLKYTERAKLDCSSLRSAVQVMHVVPKLANDMMMVARMSSYPGRIAAQGKLLLQDTFMVSQGGSGNEKERKVFFFEQSVITAELVDKKSEECGFVFKSSIKHSDLKLKDIESSNTRFILTNRNNSEKIELCASTPQIKQTWISTIQQQLDSQLDFLNALQDPISRQRQKIESTSSNNSNNNNNNRKRNNSPRPFLTSFQPNQHNNINLNCEPGGEATTLRSSLDGATTASVIQSCGSAQEGSADQTRPPPQSKHNQKKAFSPTNSDESRPRTPPFPVSALDQLEIMSDSAKERLGLPDSISSSTEKSSASDTGNQSSARNLTKRIKPIPLRPSSASDMNSNMSRLRSQSSLSTPMTIRPSTFNSHQSAPDLSGSNSFWLSSLSPANIKSSTCKFAYPADDQNCDRVSISSSQAYSTIRSNKTTASSSPEKVTAVVVKDYKAVKEDEVNVKKGENLDVIATNAQGLCLVYRASTSSVPAAEGWVPSSVLSHTSNQNRKGRVTPRMVKRNNAKKSPNSPGPLSRLLGRSRSSDKLNEKSDQSLSIRCGSSHSVDLLAR